MPGLSCGMQALVPWPGIEPGPSTLGVWSLSPWTTRKSPWNTCWLALPSASAALFTSPDSMRGAMKWNHSCFSPLAPRSPAGCFSQRLPVLPDCNQEKFSKIYAHTRVCVCVCVCVIREVSLNSWWGFRHSSVGKESAYNAGDPGSIPGSGRSPE